MEPTPNNASGKIVAALIIGLLVGFAAGVFWQERRSDSLMQPDSSSQAAAGMTEAQAVGGKGQTASVSVGASAMTEGTIASVKGLTVVDQPAGGSVEIAAIDAKEVLWAAVREEKDGKIGNILGAQKVFVGDGQKVEVELLRPTITANVYRVVLYRDVGSPAFNYKEDTLIEGVEGRFTAK